MVVINPTTGDTVLKQSFDTHTSSSSLQQALADVASGHIIAVGVSYEGALALS